MRLAKLKGVLGIITILALVTSLFVFTSPQAKANPQELSTLNEYLQQKLSSETTNPAERKALKKVWGLRQITEQQVLQSLRDSSAKSSSVSDIGILSTTHISLGSDYTFLYAGEGKNGGTKTGVGNYTTSYDLSNCRNLVGSWTVGAGQASGWAWTGRRFYIDGSGSQTATFSVDGYYAAMLHAVGSSSNSIMDLRLRLYDATDGQWVEEGTVSFKIEIDKTMSHVENYTRDNIVQATLEGGHEYVILLEFEGTVTAIAGYLAEVESGRPDLLFYSDWASIDLDF